ncbi:homoserine O-succinyltransferase [Alginatibacterium sediminis]|uniref:Homoserine O-succinyltransferase n=1 Tax=Alginatibacterium sediminis TaxID=2164068 RepID=A0A420E7G5_9ALTE|nr:homoserine O-succinyltransferase [Alginatibacterium sediminis]RKF14424.1 homoserine O-succinyltransferase [Alginatibacterium sediminis]
MPIRIPDLLPAADVLRSENIFVMPESRASTQNIRPLEVILLNLMPKKIETENQILRLLSNTPLQVNIKLLRIDSRVSKNTPKAHIDSFYRDFDKIKTQNFDGLIITGAPLGQVDFEDVYYWEQIKEIIDWSCEHVTSTLFLCWAAQAALYHLYGMEKKTRDTKLSGVYQHRTLHPQNPLLRGFDDMFWAPLSRYAEFSALSIEQQSDLLVLADNQTAGTYLAASTDFRQIYITGHPEYDVDTLDQEYRRDLSEGLEPVLPENYYSDNDVTKPPVASWRSHGHLLYANWLNYCVYQQTPYDLHSLTPRSE